MSDRTPPLRCTDCAVRRFALFQPFSGEALAELNRVRRAVRTYPAGARVVEPDSPDDELFTVFAGWAFSFNDANDGRRQIIDFHLPGDLVGVDRLGAAATKSGVEAITPLAICVFSRSALMEAAARIPALGAALSWMASREEAVLAERVASLGRRRAALRLGHLLLELWTRQRWRTGSTADSCEFPPTSGHLADCLGLTPEHVSRALKELREDGLVELQRRRLAIPNAKALAELCDWTDGYLRPRPLL